MDPNNYIDLKMRIPKDETGTDKYTKEEIREKMRKGTISFYVYGATIYMQDSTNTDRIMGVIETK